MSLLPNYIFKEILEPIIKYLYNDTKFKKNKEIKLTNENNNEIITYSLVSKHWFNTISNLFPIHLKYHNIKILKPLIEIPDSKYKLIKNNDIIKVSSLTKFYQSNHDNDVINKKAIIRIKDHNHVNINELKELFKQPNENIEFLVNIQLVYREDFNENNIIKINTLIDNFNFYGKIKSFNIFYKAINIEQCKIVTELYKKVLEFKKTKSFALHGLANGVADSYLFGGYLCKTYRNGSVVISKEHFKNR
ncbi:hypothetical protein DICPUDRAFT_76575 [Dictyostelium purpureum]|uniref:Uncharacterized protein n=1 Tax=Dictyostelium purpureum TaxID=5786 RepID=F0ZE10_DICPU|nr:uncharacterized protein DICPUDRAFT_76575 [Dictyostelium purpureum]EGC37799.1 hypothetical protein DICPUDRAFT_76575 [Dictyostelium purpureum]|eukprot:XP_003285644.1 hypothetical protein DICPUDRAFT_76575 [Dictyostelium purpureum]